MAYTYYLRAVKWSIQLTVQFQLGASAVRATSASRERCRQTVKLPTAAHLLGFCGMHETPQEQWPADVVVIRLQRQFLCISARAASAPPGLMLCPCYKSWAHDYPCAFPMEWQHTAMGMASVKKRHKSLPFSRPPDGGIAWLSCTLREKLWPLAPSAAVTANVRGLECLSQTKVIGEHGAR